MIEFLHDTATKIVNISQLIKLVLFHFDIEERRGNGWSLPRSVIGLSSLLCSSKINAMMLQVLACSFTTGNRTHKVGAAHITD